MAQHTHVPRFGNWERENVPYTTYFENARKERGAGTKIFNPNDPEENPDAFISGTFTPEHELGKPYHIENSYDYGSHRAVHAPPSLVTSDKDMSVLKQHHSREDNGFQSNMESPSPYNCAHYRENINPQSRHKGSNSESSSGKSNSGYSLMQSQHHRRPSMNSDGDVSGFSPSPPPQPRARVATVKSQRVETHHRVASIPKFGAWDETDPTASEGFTIIFSKVKEEKQIAASKLHKVPTEPITYPDKLRNSSTSSSKTKMLCCFFPTASP